MLRTGSETARPLSGIRMAGFGGETVVLVSHRPSTFRHVNWLVKLSEGRAVIERDLAGLGAGLESFAVLDRAGG